MLASIANCRGACGDTTIESGVSAITDKMKHGWSQSDTKLVVDVMFTRISSMIEAHASKLAYGTYSFETARCM